MSFSNDGQNVCFDIPPTGIVNLRNLTSLAATAIVTTSAGSKIFFVLLPGSEAPIEAGHETLAVEVQSFTPAFDRLKVVDMAEARSKPEPQFVEHSSGSGAKEVGGEEK